MSNTLESTSVRPPGRPGHLSEEEKLEIRTAWFEVPQPTKLQLAARFGVNRDTIAAVLKGPEFEALQADLLKDVKERAKRRLEMSADRLVEDWLTASGEGAHKGDHKPAKDALQAIGVVESDKGGNSGPTVIVGGGGNVNVGVLFTA